MVNFSPHPLRFSANTLNRHWFLISLVGTSMNVFHLYKLFLEN